MSIQGVSGEIYIYNTVSMYVCTYSVPVYHLVCHNYTVRLSSSVVRDGRKCLAIQRKIDHFEVLSFSLSTFTVIFVVLYLVIYHSCTDSPFQPRLPISLPPFLSTNTSSSHSILPHFYLMCSKYLLILQFTIILL